ncbi:Mitochondrial presequence protease, partial [Bonamia ostreae]
MFAKSKNLKICCLKNKRAFSASSEKFKNGQKLNNFTINKIKNFKKFNLNLVQMTHRTGANYVHISAKDNNNVFGIAFKTPNYSDNGIPHILEHCVLCGSKKYPINDPFMKM